MTWQQLYSLNKSTIGSNPNLIRVGQILKLPNGGTYTVKSGDSLSKIASGISSGAIKTSTPTATKPTTTSIAQQAQKIAQQVPVRAKSFEEVLPFSNFFDQDLAKASIRERVEKFFAPQIDRGIEDIRQQFAQRGLFRSGMRGDNERNFFEDIADQFGQQEQSLFTTREAEEKGRYSLEQERFEKDPTKYTAPKVEVTGPAPVYQPTQYGQILDRYGFGSAPEAPNTFMQSFRDFWKTKYEDPRGTTPNRITFY